MHQLDNALSLNKVLVSMSLFILAHLVKLLHLRRVVFNSLKLGWYLKLTTAFSEDDFEAFDSSFFNKQQQAIETFKQETIDAELARSLSTGNPAPPSNARSQPSAFDRLSGVRYPPAASLASTKSMHNDADYDRNWAVSTTTAPSRVKREGPPVSSRMNSYPSKSVKSPNRVKSEALSSIAMPGAFIDDLSAGSDSDFEIIDSEAFNDRGRYTPSLSGSRFASSGNRHGIGQEALTAGAAARSAAQRDFPFTNQQTGLDNIHYLSNQASGSSARPLPNFSQMTALLGSYRPLPNSSQTPALSGPHPDPGMRNRNRVSSEDMQVYQNKAELSGMNYTSYGNADSTIRNVGLGRAYSLNPLDDGLEADYKYQPSPFMDAGGSIKPDPYATIIDHMSDIFSRPAHLGMADQFDYIMNDPRKTNEEIKVLLENIRPDAELPAEDREGTPDGLVYPLVCWP